VRPASERCPSYQRRRGLVGWPWSRTSTSEQPEAEIVPGAPSAEQEKDPPGRANTGETPGACFKHVGQAHTAGYAGTRASRAACRGGRGPHGHASGRAAVGKCPSRVRHLASTRRKRPHGHASGSAPLVSGLCHRTSARQCPWPPRSAPVPQPQSAPLIPLYRYNPEQQTHWLQFPAAPDQGTLREISRKA